MLGSDRQFDKAIAESVFGWQVEVVKPEWYPYEELEVIEMIHRAMISSAGLRIHYYCNPGSNGNISYNVEIVRQPKSLPKRCWGEDGKTLGDALVSALRKFLEIVKEEHGNV